MAVDSLASLRSIVYASSLLFSVVCYAEIDINSTAVLNHVSESILEATTSYSDRISYCDNQVKSNEAPKLDKEYLNSLNATRENSLTAVVYLKSKNYFLCERDARLELAFHLGTMESIRRELLIDPSAVKKLQSIISYPSIRELELELEYLKLPKPQRKYFESVFGIKPYDLMKTLESNQLIRE